MKYDITSEKWQEVVESINKTAFALELFILATDMLTKANNRLIKSIEPLHLEEEEQASTNQDSSTPVGASAL